jgi:hypothetical protein
LFGLKPIFRCLFYPSAKADGNENSLFLLALA